MKDPLDFDRERWERIKCPACGWVTDVQIIDKLERGMEVDKAIRHHIDVCSVISPRLSRARGLLTEIDGICEELNCTIEALIIASGYEVRNEQRELEENYFEKEKAS